MRKAFTGLMCILLLLGFAGCSSERERERERDLTEKYEEGYEEGQVAGYVERCQEERGREKISEDTSPDGGEYLVTETGHCFHYVTCWTISDSEKLTAYPFEDLPFDQDACRFCKPPMNGVWVTEGEGTKHYHNYKCEHTKGSPSVHKVEVQKALDRGLTPCPDCNPWAST